MINKKGQQEIIVTVLLVLLALAAVVLIAGFIMRNVRQGGEVGESRVNCLSLDYEVTRAANGESTISVRRNTGGENVNVTGIKILVDSTNRLEMKDLPGILETRSACIDTNVSNNCTNSSFVTGQLTTGQKIEIAPVLQGGTVCDVEAQKIVTSA